MSHTMKAIFSDFKYNTGYNTWGAMYFNLFQGLNNLGIDIEISEFLDIEEIPSYVKVGITHSEEAFYFYNHSNLLEVNNNGFKTGQKCFFIKPTAPSPDYFTIDPLGYSAFSSPTFTQTHYKEYNYYSFFSEKVPKFKALKSNKWDEYTDISMDKSSDLELPEDHILILGQCEGDEVVQKFSLGVQEEILVNIVNSIKHLDIPIIVKLHPLDKTTDVNKFKNIKNTILLTEPISLYNILNGSRVVICGNSSSIIEALMFQKPVITYMQTEFNSVTYNLNQLILLPEIINNIKQWHNVHLCNSFISWYCDKYQVFDVESATTRLRELILDKRYHFNV